MCLIKWINRDVCRDTSVKPFLKISFNCFFFQFSYNILINCLQQKGKKCICNQNSVIDKKKNNLSTKKSSIFKRYKVAQDKIIIFWIKPSKNQQVGFCRKPRFYQVVLEKISSQHLSLLVSMCNTISFGKLSHHSPFIQMTSATCLVRCLCPSIGFFFPLPHHPFYVTPPAFVGTLCSNY